MVRKLFPILLVVFISVLSSLSLFHSGLPPTHDGEYHVIRFFEFDIALRDGDWYPRWAKDLQFGYGVPLFNFVYPLPNYISSLIHLWGFSFIDSFKMSMIAASVLSGIFMHLWAKKWWGTLGGIVVSSVYVFSPYRLLDVYVRGSVGEVWALALFPAFLWAITEYLTSQSKKFFYFSVMFFTGIVFSHNILALMFVPFALSYVLLLKFLLKRKLLSSFTPFVLGIGLAAIFWLPALAENKYVVGLEIFVVGKHFPDLFQLLIPSWGTGFSGLGLQNQMSFQLGVVNIFIVIVSLFCLFFLRAKKRRNEKVVIIFSLVWLVTILFLMLPYSQVLWDRVPFMSYFQFPWRFLSLFILLSSFLAGSVFALIQKKKLSIVIACVIVLISYLLTASYTKFAYYHDRDDRYYTSRSNFIDGTNSPGNVFNTKWVKGIDSRAPFIQFSKEKGKFEILESKTSYHKVLVFTPIDQTISLATTYFPGWTVYVDEERVEINPREKGEISLYLNKGPHLIESRFESTVPRTVGLILTVFSFMLLLILLRDKIYKSFLPI